MSITNILTKQRELLRVIAKKHRTPLDNISECSNVTKGMVIDYIKNQQWFLSEEITELMLAIGDNNRAIIKPWSTGHKFIAIELFKSNAHIQSEAIDMLCFCINICLASGITPETIEQEYQKVWEKNMHRQEEGY
jgi:phosphoribosyl-ATP pyrophosphohydrolase